MKHPEPEYEQMKVPHLTDQVKKMNGKSGHRLSQCIDALSDLLDENNEVQHEEAVEEPDSLRDTDTE
ncbi:MAG: hypothetical protein ACXABY_01790 [Candidatus Thorarchaeota archaeon]|jgi:hypothetical protein